MKVAGIYQIICSVNGHFYIGSSSNIPRRWYKHRYMLTRGLHPNRYLQNAVNRHGLNSFKLTIVELTTDLLNRENHFIRFLRPIYNIASDALGGDTISKNPNRTTIIEKIRASNLIRWNKMPKKERKRLRQIRIKANTGLKRDLAQYKCRSVVIDGVTYPSLSEASRQLGIPIMTLHYRLQPASTCNAHTPS